jgi:Uma2 family endonuclease
MTSMPPRLEGFTVADWEEAESSKGRRLELHHGNFLVSPPPVPRHQRIADRLCRQLDDALTDVGLEALSAIGVRVSSDTAYIPDITVVPLQPDDAVSVAAGDVSLAVEVVSPGSRRMDRVEKPAALAAAGVPRYWRIEHVPGEPPTIVAYVLRGDVYSETITVTAGSPAEVEIADAVSVRLDVHRLAAPR